MPAQSKSTRQLLAQYASILQELRRRGVVRSTDNPVADYAEKLVARGLHLKLAANSTAGFDATDPATDEKYQIKGRRISNYNAASKNPQVSAIRDLDKRRFDFLVGVTFDEDFTLKRAVKSLTAQSTRSRPTLRAPAPIGSVCCSRSGIDPMLKTLRKSCGRPRR